LGWLPWFLPPLLLVLAIAALLRRRTELLGFSSHLGERERARARGSHRARLQHPQIDLRQCIGCGACVQACPEEGVLALAYGQAAVVHGARCVGHGRCADACPTGAIALTLGDLGDREDLPAVSGQLEAVGVPGLFLAGELTGFSLVRTAIQHGAQVAREVSHRVRAGAGRPEEPAPEPAADAVLDLLIVGMGPAGLACALAAREQGLRLLCLEQQATVGGTVAAYPRRKLVMTQPVELPLHGRLKRLEYQKEELVHIWSRLVDRYRLPIRCGEEVRQVERLDDGTFAVATTASRWRARHVCLALGRRGSPRKLGVPGEDLPKVSYSLLDAASYQQRRILVVGGGDSAVEAALALAEQGTNAVTLSYRKEAFFRLKARNEQRVDEALRSGTVDARFLSEVVRIEPDAVVLRGQDGERALPNDEVFVFAGGTPPFPLLEAAGVSFDPAARPAAPATTDRGNGLLAALSLTLAGTLALLAFGLWHGDYYLLSPDQRADAPQHALLGPRGAVGLAAGVAAVALFAVNLLYLLRRARIGSRLPGSLRSWMSVHVGTGLFAFLCVALHAGFHVRDTVGGHAFLTLLVVVAAGVVGRWFYAFVPRAASGRQQGLEEIGAQVAALSGEWDVHGRGFGGEVRAQVEALAGGAQWRRGFVARVLGLLGSQLRLRLRLRGLRRRGLADGIPAAEVAHVLALASRAHRLALQLAHYEEVRGVLSSWRWLHRWLALVMVLLTAVHVATAAGYGGLDWSLLWSWFGGGP
jgi:thioredoxin reductase/ferredoxin